MYPVSPTNPASGYQGATTQYPTSYSGTFIPEIWSSKLIEKYYDGTVLNQITNTDYEGEIQNYGDKVIIRTRPAVSVKEYQIGQKLETEFPEAPVEELPIDKGLYYQTAIDDIIAKQQDIDQMNLWAEESSEEMKISLDSEVLAYLPANVHSQNTGLTAGRISGNINLGTVNPSEAVTITKDNILHHILLLGQVLDEQNVPETGRFLVLPFWATTMLKASDIKDASLTGDGSSPLRNGLVGRIDRFVTYNSNLLPLNNAADEWHTCFLAGHKAAATFATQMTKTETLRAQNTFGDLMRGLLVYGYKMLKSEAMAASFVRNGGLPMA